MNNINEAEVNNITSLYNSIQFSVNVLSIDINDISFIVDGITISAIDVIKLVNT